MEVSIEKEKLKESKKDEAHSDMSKKEGKPSITAPHSTAGKLEKQYDQSLMGGIAATDSGYNGSGDGSRDNTSSGRDSGSRTGSALGTSSAVGSGSRAGSGCGSGNGDGKCIPTSDSRAGERRDTANKLMEPSTTARPPLSQSELSTDWTRDCAVSIAVTTTDSGICSNYTRGQDSEQADTSQRSARMASVRSSGPTSDSEGEEGKEAAQSTSINDGSQGRKRGPLSSVDHSSLKKRKKCELWYYDNGGTGFSVAICLTKGIIIHVTDSIMQFLGYPKDFWPGRMFMNFVHKKDLIVFNDQLMDCNVGTPYEARSGSFYCRLRTYPGLKNSFSMPQTTSFRPFYVKYRLKNVILQGKDVSPEEVTPRRCMTMIAQPLISPYRRGIAASAKFQFHTRQSIFGNLESIDTNGICTLGYLPQDIVGTCIFHRWHEEDLSKAISTFMQLVDSPEGECHSDNYRISTNNGHYITIQTIWRLHTNNSKMVEYVQGTHRLLDGPSNINVFACCNQEVSERHHMLALQVKSAVKEILSSPIGGRKGSKRILTVKDETSPKRFSSTQEQISSDSSDFPEGSEDSSKEFKSASANAQSAEPTATATQPVNNPPLPVETNIATWGSYQQLNYAYNIRRFLQSHPKVLPNEGWLKSDKEADGTDIVVVAPPPNHAGSSSAVVHVSEHLSGSNGERPAGYAYSDEATVNDGESGNICSKEGSGSGNGSGSKDHPDLNGELDGENPRSTLTQQLMKIHNNVQEQIYLQQMKKLMEDDASYPLVAFPHDNQAQQRSAAQTASNSVEKVSKPVAKTSAQNLDTQDTDNIVLSKQIPYDRREDPHAFKQRLLGRLKPLLEKKKVELNANVVSNLSRSPSNTTPCITVSSSISTSNQLSSSNVLDSLVQYSSLFSTSTYGIPHSMKKSQPPPAIQHLPFRHQPSSYTQPLTSVNIPTPLQALHPALQLVNQQGVLHNVNEGLILNRVTKPKTQTVATQTSHSKVHSKRKAQLMKDATTMKQVSSIVVEDDDTAGYDMGSDDTFSVSLTSQDSSAKEESADVERPKPFWLEGIKDTSKLLNYTMEEASNFAQKNIEEHLENLPQPYGLRNQLQEMVIDINKEKSIKLYQTLIYIEDDMARLEVDGTGRGVGVRVVTKHNFEPRPSCSEFIRANKSTTTDIKKHPMLAPWEKSSQESDWRGKLPIWSRHKQKSKSKNPDVVSMADRKPKWSHEKRTPLTELDILNNMFCRVHINFPMQTLHDAEFPWHCLCDSQSPANIDFPDAEDQLPDETDRGQFVRNVSDHDVTSGVNDIRRVASPVKSEGSKICYPLSGHDDSSQDEDSRARLENALRRDRRVLDTFTQPRAVFEQMEECGIRTFGSGSDTDPANSLGNNSFFDSVD